jgi:hypothetical protein
MLEISQKFNIQGKELKFSQILYVSDEIAIAILPLAKGQKFTGLFYRNGRASIRSTKSALRRTHLYLIKEAPDTYMGIKYLRLGDRNDESDSIKI